MRDEAISERCVRNVGANNMERHWRSVATDTEALLGNDARVP
jgi:hypothetical protein